MCCDWHRPANAKRKVVLEGSRENEGEEERALVCVRAGKRQVMDAAAVATAESKNESSK